MVFFQDAMQITHETICEVIERVKKDNYSYIRKSITKIFVNNDGCYSEQPYTYQELDFYMLKDLGL